MAADLKVTLNNDLAEVQRLSGLVEAFGERQGWPSEIVFNVNLCLDELITNIVSYAYADAARHEIAVHLVQRNGRIEIEVLDDGRPFDPLTETKAPDLESALDERQVGGLGVHFVRTLMDEVAYVRDGGRNRLTMVKSLKGA